MGSTNCKWLWIISVSQMNSLACLSVFLLGCRCLYVCVCLHVHRRTFHSSVSAPSFPCFLDTPVTQLCLNAWHNILKTITMLYSWFCNACVCVCVRVCVWGPLVYKGSFDWSGALSGAVAKPRLCVDLHACALPLPASMAALSWHSKN